MKYLVFWIVMTTFTPQDQYQPRIESRVDTLTKFFDSREDAICFLHGAEVNRSVQAAWMDSTVIPRPVRMEWSADGSYFLHNSDTIRIERIEQPF